MTMLSLKIIDNQEKTRFVSRGEDQVILVNTSAYQEGDRIYLESSEKNVYLMIQLDDAIEPVLVYVTDNISFTVPFGEKRIVYSPKAFWGERHYLYARVATKEEVKAYRNLALNPLDQPSNTTYYPHASANVETRNEAVFAARNAIDGVVANSSHGEWPYESWGINRREDACIKVDFGREVEIDKIILYTRADFPHDSWWKQVSFNFSDGSTIDFPMKKSLVGHVLNFEKKRVSWVVMDKLIKADDASPFPALSQIEIYGREIIK